MNTVYGLEFTPDPSRLGKEDNPSKAFRIYCATEADRAYLRESIRLSIHWVQQRGRMSSESERYPSALMGLIAGDSVRGYGYGQRN